MLVKANAMMMTLSWGRGFWLASKLSCCWVRFSLTHQFFFMKDCSLFWKLARASFCFETPEGADEKHDQTMDEGMEKKISHESFNGKIHQDRLEWFDHISDCSWAMEEFDERFQNVLIRHLRPQFSCGTHYGMTGDSPFLSWPKLNTLCQILSKLVQGNQQSLDFSLRHESQGIKNREYQCLAFLITVLNPSRIPLITSWVDEFRFLFTLAERTSFEVFGWNIAYLLSDSCVQCFSYVWTIRYVTLHLKEREYENL